MECNRAIMCECQSQMRVSNLAHGVLIGVLIAVFVWVLKCISVNLKMYFRCKALKLNVFVWMSKPNVGEQPCARCRVLIAMQNNTMQGNVMQCKHNTKCGWALLTECLCNTMQSQQWLNVKAKPCARCRVFVLIHLS